MYKEMAQIDSNSNRTKQLRLNDNFTFKEFYDEIFEETNKRTEFSKDRDRILFSRAFRRLVHKAQVYSPSKGDHFRTRLTHSLEVAQISKSLAHYLNLNEELAESIALGHDIGHTPFGHQGERILDEILKGSETLNGKIRLPLNLGGFKHNYNSIKILEENESKYSKEHIDNPGSLFNCNGLDLSWQVLEGIIKHTRIKRCKKINRKCDTCHNCWEIKRFTENKELIDKLTLGCDNSITLEGQIVAIADEIAQRQHDLDDGLRDNSLNLEVKQLLKDLSKKIDSIKELEQNTSTSHKLIIKLQEQIKELEKTDDILFIKNTLIRNIIEYFIIDVTLNSKNNFINIEEEEKSKKIFKNEYISFSNYAKSLDDGIEQLIKSRIINSYDVNRYDGKAIYIVKQIFKAYYTNPRQMPKYILDRLSRNIKKTIDKSKNGEIEESINITKLFEILSKDFQKNEPSEVNSMIGILKLNEEELTNFDLELNDIDICQKIFNTTWEETDKNNVVKKLILECSYCYIETISNYIAGMTDNYATKEFAELY